MPSRRPTFADRSPAPRPPEPELDALRPPLFGSSKRLAITLWTLTILISIGIILAATARADAGALAPAGPLIWTAPLMSTGAAVAIAVVLALLLLALIIARGAARPRGGI